MTDANGFYRLRWGEEPPSGRATPQLYKETKRPKRPPKKYKPGCEIVSLDELVSLCRHGRWLYAWTERPIHPGWIMSQRLHVIDGLRRQGKLRLAEERLEWQEWKTSHGCPL